MSAESEDVFRHATAVHVVRALDLAFGATRPPACRRSGTFRHRAQRAFNQGRSGRTSTARKVVGVENGDAEQGPASRDVTSDVLPAADTRWTASQSRPEDENGDAKQAPVGDVTGDGLRQPTINGKLHDAVRRLRTAMRNRGPHRGM